MHQIQFFAWGRLIILTLEQFWLKKGRVSIANYVSVESISNAPGVIIVSTVLYAG